MTLDQLRYFKSAAELQHIGKAAVKENISQPSLSISIKKLEKELGVVLFRGNGRGIELTEQGKEFMTFARGILSQVEAAKAHMAKQADKLNTEIHMAYTASMSFVYIPKLFKEFFSATNAGYLVYSDEMPSDDIVRGLKEGRFDFGICSKVDEDADIVQRPIIYQPLVLIVPKGDPERYDTAADLCRSQGKPFVSYRQDYPMYKQITGLFEQENIKPRISHYAYSEDAIARLVEQGLGISIVASTDSLPLYQIEIRHPKWLQAGRYIYITYHKNRYHGKAAKEMMEYIEKNTY